MHKVCLGEVAIEHRETCKEKKNGQKSLEASDTRTMEGTGGSYEIQGEISGGRVAL